MRKAIIVIMLSLASLPAIGQAYFKTSDSSDIALSHYLDLISQPDTIRGMLTFYIEETPYLVPVRTDGYVVVKRWEGVVFVWVDKNYMHGRVYHSEGCELDKDRYYEFIPFRTAFQKVK